MTMRIDRRPTNLDFRIYEDISESFQSLDLQPGNPIVNVAQRVILGPLPLEQEKQLKTAFTPSKDGKYFSSQFKSERVARVLELAANALEKYFEGEGAEAIASIRELDSRELENVELSLHKLRVRFMESFTHGNTVSGPDDLVFNEWDTLENIAQHAFDFTEEALSTREAIPEEDILKIHDLLFTPPLNRISEKAMSSRRHVANVIHTLTETILAIRTNPKKAKSPTSSEGREGANGSYFLKNREGVKLWVFKPSNEEVRAGEGIPLGACAKREHLAHLLNINNSFPIPFTVFIKLGKQIGSAQMFMPGKDYLETRSRAESSEYPSSEDEEIMESLSPKLLQKKTVFDITFGNGDGHLGNLLCETKRREDNYFGVSAIDNGQICSSSKDDSILIAYVRDSRLEWPLSEEAVHLCLNPPIEKYLETVRQHSIGEEAISLILKRISWCKNAIKVALENEGLGRIDLKDIAVVMEYDGAYIFEVDENTMQTYAQAVMNLKNLVHTYSKQVDVRAVRILGRHLKESPAGAPPSRENILGFPPGAGRKEDFLSRLWSVVLRPIMGKYEGMPKLIFDEV
ncbi:MAG: hypothetical protein ACI9S8_000518 [Chlamydiales bacterium]|jgi:hypothetical protein